LVINRTREREVKQPGNGDGSGYEKEKPQVSFKPADFFLGVMEFFAILMPGVLLTFLLLSWRTPLFGDLLPPLPGTAGKWIAFLVVSYVLGHLLHHVGGVLDTAIYDKLYVNMWKRKCGEERLLTRAKELKKQALGNDNQMVNTFSWAAAYVRTHNGAAGNELERGGADSKFFRSLSLVSLVALAAFALEFSLLATVGALLLLAFSLWRFCILRWKNTQLTYQYFIMLIMDQEMDGVGAAMDQEMDGVGAVIR
jgi:hypothetical protein